MPHIRLALIRHSKSCSNYVRGFADNGVQEEAIVAASQTLQDPALSRLGERAARAYGPILASRLTAAGFSLDTALIGSSPLRRARQTAQLLFNVTPRILPHITENGDIPENTPAGHAYEPPDWRKFLQAIAAMGDPEVIVVGHGSFLKGCVWSAVAGRAWDGEFHNLDAFVIEGELTSEGRLEPRAVQILRTTPADFRGDSCVLSPKINTLIRMSSKQKARQRGGATNMPLAYFKDGAQMVGTRAEPTGVGLAGTSDSWVRMPLQQKGGRSGGKGRSGGRRRRTLRRQAGGFTPSIMGSFAANGMRLLPPMAVYSGYKLFKKKGTRRHSHRRHSHRHRR